MKAGRSQVGDRRGRRGEAVSVGNLLFWVEGLDTWEESSSVSAGGAEAGRTGEADLEKGGRKMKFLSYKI